MFETYLTVRLPGRLGEGNEELAGGRRGMNYAKILLHRGAAPQQSMLTNRGSGTLLAGLRRRIRRCAHEG